MDDIVTLEFIVIFPAAALTKQPLGFRIDGILFRMRWIHYG